MSSSLIVAGAVVVALIAVSLAFRHGRAGASPGTVEELRNA